jgi:nitrite reductase/ring-hydroxylating ferredoxin subunit
MPEYANVAKLSDIAPGQVRSARVNAGVDLCLANVAGTIYAVAGGCPHERGALAEGTLEGDTLICPLHGAMFDVTNGDVLGPPADEPLKSFRVRVQGDDISVVFDD